MKHLAAAVVASLLVAACSGEQSGGVADAPAAPQGYLATQEKAASLNDIGEAFVKLAHFSVAIGQHCTSGQGGLEELAKTFVDHVACEGVAGLT